MILDLAAGAMRLFGGQKTSMPPAPKRNGTPNPRGAASVLASGIRREDKSIYDIVERMERDYQVKLARLTIAANIFSIDVTVSAESPDPRARALADHLQRLWDATLPQMLNAVPYGRMAFEKVQEYDSANNLNFIECLDPLPYKETSMKLDTETGGFEGIKLKCGEESITLDADKSWWLALDATAMELHGKSQYLGAPYETFLKREKTRRRFDVFMNRNAVRGWIVYHPMDEEDERGNRYDPGEVTAAQLDAIRSGGHLMLPNLLHPQDPAKYAYDVKETTEVLDTAPLLAVIVSEDAEQLRAFGIPEKTVTEGDAVGSFAMVKQQTLILYSVIDRLMGQFAASFQRYVIDKSIDLNFERGDRPHITITVAKLAQRPDSVTSQLVSQILGSPQLNPILISGGVDLRKMLESVGVPVTEDLMQRLVAFEKQEQTQRAAQLPQFDQPKQMGAGQGDVAGGESDTIDLSEGDAAPDVPTRDKLASAIDKIYADKYQQFLEAVRQRDWRTVQAILDDMDALRLEASVASRVLGLMTPLVPAIQAHDLAHGEAATIDLAATVAPAVPGASGASSGDWSFPWLDNAVQWLRAKQILPVSGLRGLDYIQRQQVLSVPGLSDSAKLNRLKQSLATSVRTGATSEDAAEHAETMLGQSLASAGLDEAQWQNLFRTNIHQAYVAGFDGAMQSPAVKRTFTCVQFAATRDSRTRPSHAWLGGDWRDWVGIVVEVGSAAYDLVMQALAAFGCRCTAIPVTQDDAERIGITRMGDIVPWVIESSRTGREPSAALSGGSRG
jgi:hypothetical protein